MDPLAEICAAMRVQSVLFTRIDAYAPWGWTSRGESNVKFVLVVRGAGMLVLPKRRAPIALRGGDVFIMLDDTPYKMLDEKSSGLLDCVNVESRRVGNHIKVGGKGTLTTFVSGIFDVDRSDASALFSVLPSFLLLKAEEGRTRAFEAVLDLLAAESAQPGLGSEAMKTSMFELLLVHAVRAYAAQEGAPKEGWLAAMSDRALAGAVEAMHQNLAEDWTVERLAKIGGMSRSSFAIRFKTMTGQTPLEYLTRWRMHRASQLIRRNEKSLSEVALAVGYRSDAAFNRVFKREVGTTPGLLRRTALAR